MYSWTAFVAAQILVEIPWSILSSAVFYFCWYWTVGFPNDRAGYSFLMLAVMFPTYYTTIGQAVAAMCPSAEIAGLVFGTLFSFVLSLCVLFSPFSDLTLSDVILVMVSCSHIANWAGCDGCIE